MKRRKQIALNKLFNSCIVFGLLFVWLSFEFFNDGENELGIGTAIASLFILFPSILTPFCYAFDSEGVSLCYLFLPVERYLWKDIHAIEVDDTSFGSRSFLIDFLYAYVFSIKGKSLGKKRFYMNGNIRKSFRTKHLLEKYWDGTITGYLLEDAKKWINKRKAKKQTQIKSHLADEIVPMEREIRTESREWLNPLVSQAKQFDLDIKTRYLYITKDFDEFNSRPNEGYTYTLIAEIAHFNETDENRIVVIDVDLLYVRLGKTSYRGVKNEHARDELTSTVSDVLDEINRIGIDAYCSGD